MYHYQLKILLTTIIVLFLSNTASGTHPISTQLASNIPTILKMVKRSFLLAMERITAQYTITMSTMMMTTNTEMITMMMTVTNCTVYRIIGIPQTLMTLIGIQAQRHSVMMTLMELHQVLSGNLKKGPILVF